jgi:cryptochrome
MSNNNDEKISIHWFRNGLRLHDNPCLLDACNQSDKLLPLYVIDPDAPFAQTQGRGAGCIRANFVLESMKELDAKLTDMNSKLVVVLGKPEQVLPEIVASMNVSSLYYEREPAAPIREADAQVLQAIRQRLKEGGDKQKCTMEGYDTHTLHPMEHYVSCCKDNVAPSSYGGFTKIFERLGPVPSEVERVESCPPLPDNVDKLKDTFDCDLTVPDLEILGYDKNDLKNRDKGGISFQGGEEAGLALLDKMMKRTQWVSTFEKPKTSPNALTVDTTGLSPYVKHGLVSPRRFYHELTKTYDKFPAAKVSKPPVSLHGQLMWREYNNLMGYTTPNFDKMVGNPVARQIPWDDDETLLEKWRDSQTGYPFIDAIMVQLKETGWIHHLARHAVACFLTRGDLWLSWEQGAAVFEERLIDADWSLNNFNWQWLSCTAHFYQYFRCYSPVTFGKKTDPNGDYIRKWLPQFKTFPKKYIYEPWNAPLDVQKNCGVIIGEDYPEPIVDHRSISKSNMSRMKDAYDAHKANESNAASTSGSSNNSGSTPRKRQKTSN